MSHAVINDWLRHSSAALAFSYDHQEPQPTQRAKRELLWLLEALINVKQPELIANPNRRFTQFEQTTLNDALSQVIQGKPLAYIIGEQPFWTLNLKVTKDTLIPRADTETLVEQILALPLKVDANILDLGTGTGAIALALAHERPQWQMMGVDFLTECITLAQENARIHHITNADFLLSDWFSALIGRTFDAICANPPYIETNDPYMDTSVAQYEPTSALIADDQGFADLKIIAQQAPEFLTPNGYLIMEHGFKQGERIYNFMQLQGFKHVTTIKDLRGLERCTLGVYPG